MISNTIAKPLTIHCAPSELSRYMVDSRAGVLAILTTLQKTGTLVTAYFSGGNNFVLTCIAAVHPETDELVLDYGADAAANQRALNATRVTLVATHENIKIQFYATTLRHVRFENRDAFSTPLPAALLRLQRREYFRVATPLAHPLRCVISPQPPDISAAMELVIIDLSCGGVGLRLAGSHPAFVTDARLKDCHIPLPEIGSVTTDLRIRNTCSLPQKSGEPTIHIGCEFASIPERERAKVQRYINNVERDRRKRAVAD